MLIYNYIHCQLSLTTKLDGIVNTFQVKFLRSSCKEIKYTCTHLYTQKTRPTYIFTVIFVHLDVVIREGKHGIIWNLRY